MIDSHLDMKFWSEKGILHILPEIPERTSFSAKEFFKHYSLSHHCYYRIGEQSRSRKYIGSSENRICSLCNRTSDETSFRKRSHIVPESLGNKIFFSLEECDECNEKYGKEYEDELAKLFGTSRLWRGVTGSNSTPTLNLKSEGKLKFSNKRGLIINVDRSLEGTPDSSYEIDSENKLLHLHLDPVTTKPAKAVLSILKSAWLLMNKDERQSYNFIHQMITNPRGKELTFYQFTLPGVITHPSLYLYKKISKNISSPDFIIRLDFQNYCIFWSYPSKTDQLAFPPIYFLNNVKSKQVKMKEYKYSDVEKSTNINEGKFTLGFEGLFENSDKEDEKQNPSNYNLPKHKCTLKIGNEIFNSYSTFYRHDFELTHICISGDELPLVLDLTSNHQFNNNQITYELKPRATSPSNFSRFLESIIEFNKSPSQNILISGSFFEFNIGGFSFERLNAKKAISYLNKIESINNYFSKNFHLGNSLSRDDEKTIIEIGQLVQNGFFDSEDRVLTLSNKLEHFDDVLKHLKKDPKDFCVVIKTNANYKLFGQYLSLKELEIDMSDLKKYELIEVQPYINNKGNLVEADLKLFFRKAIVRLTKKTHTERQE